MSWTDFHRRREALDTVLCHAAQNPAAPLPSAGLVGPSALFASTEELLLALHHRWMQQLTGRLEVALAEAERSAEGDRASAAAHAWLATVKAQPVLRAVLDAHLDPACPALRAAARREQRLLALASGMAEPTEPAEQTAGVGAAFLGLLRYAPAHAALRSRAARPVPAAPAPVAEL